MTQRKAMDIIIARYQKISKKEKTEGQVLDATHVLGIRRDTHCQHPSKRNGKQIQAIKWPFNLDVALVLKRARSVVFLPFSFFFLSELPVLTNKMREGVTERRAWFY